MSLTGPITKRRSDATNAYDLLTDVIEYMLEEPKRVYMGDWIMRGDEIKRILGKEGPECGTVGCIAGNAAILSGKSWSSADKFLSGGNQTLRSGLVRLFYDTDVEANYGTKKYARIVTKRIKELQCRYKAELQAVEIEANH